MPAARKLAASGTDSSSTSVEDSASASADSLATSQDSTLDTTRVKIISGFKGYPPVSGLDPLDPQWQIPMNDSWRDTNSTISTDPKIGWIEPTDFESGPVAPNLCVTVVALETRKSYRARSVVLNNQCQVVREFDTEYVHQDTLRQATSYVVWDLKDGQQRYVADGDYYWNIAVTTGTDSTVYRHHPHLAPSSCLPNPP